MKGQMFIVTLVFLAGMIFTVQSSLSQYSVINLAETFETNEFYTTESITSVFENTIAASLTCEEAGVSLADLETFIERRVVRGSIVELDYHLDCNSWSTPPVLNLTITLESLDMDLTETVLI